MYSIATNADLYKEFTKFVDNLFIILEYIAVCGSKEGYLKYKHNNTNDELVFDSFNIPMAVTELNLVLNNILLVDENIN